MKLLVRAAAVSVLGALLLSGCSGDDAGADATAPSSQDSTAPTSTADGGRATSQNQVLGATIQVKGDVAYMVGTVKNVGERDITLQSLYVNGFKLAQVGKIIGAEVARPDGGIPIPQGGELKLGTSGWVARLEIPDGAHEAGEMMRVNLNFSDTSQVVVEAELTADVAPQ